MRKYVLAQTGKEVTKWPLQLMDILNSFIRHTYKTKRQRPYNYGKRLLTFLGLCSGSYGADSCVAEGVKVIQNVLAV